MNVTWQDLKTQIAVKMVNVIAWKTLKETSVMLAKMVTSDFQIAKVSTKYHS